MQRKNGSSFGFEALVLLGLATAVIAQPLFATLRNGATFFVAHGATSLDIVFFACTVYLIPSLVVLGLCGFARLLSTVAARLVFHAMLWLLADFFIMQTLSSYTAAVVFPSALLAATIFLGCYWRISIVRDFLRFFGIISPLFVVLFLFFSPVKNLLSFGAPLELGRASAAKTSIVMLVFDELALAAMITREGGIDGGRLPNFLRLAEMSTWYRNTTTVSTQTERAVPAILSGIRPDKEALPVLAQYPRNLFSLLEATHVINAREMFTRLCPASACGGESPSHQPEFDRAGMLQDSQIIWLHAVLPRDIAALYLPSIATSWHNFSANGEPLANGEPSANRKPLKAGTRGDLLAIGMLDTKADHRARFRDFIASIGTLGEPSVNYLHMAVPHSPLVYLPDGTRYNGADRPGLSAFTSVWTENQYLVNQGVLRYALQLEYADTMLGQVLDALEEGGRLSETLLVVVSDHGLVTAAGRHARIPQVDTLADVARVPLFIKYPRQRKGERDDRAIETIDIFPSIASVLGLALGSGVDGHSLLAPDWEPSPRQLLEAGGRIPDFEAAVELNRATQRISAVVQEGRSALSAMGWVDGNRYFNQRVPSDAERFSGLVLRVDNAKWYTEVDRDSGFLPVRLTGKLLGEFHEGLLLIALNGIFAGSGFSHDADGQVSIMLDPRLFRVGKNRLHAYMLDDEKIFELAVQSDSEGWTVTHSAGGEFRVTDASNSEYTPADKIVARAIFSSSNTKLSTLSGYACDETHSLAPHRLLLVVADTVITTAFRQFERPFFSPRESAPDQLRCWFSVDVSEQVQAVRDDITVVALFDGGRLRAFKPSVPQSARRN